MIVSGGAINSPQLLMLSGIGPADQLTALDIPVVADLPGVGKNLQDHLAIMDVVHSKEPVTLASAESLPNVARFLTLRARHAHVERRPKRAASCAPVPSSTHPTSSSSSRRSRS